MDYGFSKAFLDYIQGKPKLKDNFKSIGQFLPDNAKYPALIVFTDAVEVLNKMTPGQEKAKISFTIKVLSGYNGLQELYFLGNLIEGNFNGNTIITEDGQCINLRLMGPVFEGIQKTKACNYRSMVINGIGYINP